MTDLLLNKFISLIPKAASWLRSQEKYILEHGNSLTLLQIRDARIIPVQHPDKVRILNVPQIPLPDDPELRTAAQILGMITPHTAGLTLRYGIFIRTDYRNNREIIIHELVHTSQYERAGSIKQFLDQYVKEYVQYGYSDSPLEREAKNMTNLICGNQPSGI